MHVQGLTIKIPAGVAAVSMFATPSAGYLSAAAITAARFSVLIGSCFSMSKPIRGLTGYFVPDSFLGGQGLRSAERIQRGACCGGTPRHGQCGNPYSRT